MTPREAWLAGRDTCIRVLTGTEECYRAYARQRDPNPMMAEHAATIHAAILALRLLEPPHGL